MSEPVPSDVNWPRYSSWPFPPYRFVKGRTPHPRRDPSGHSFGRPEPHFPTFPPEQWRQSQWYLYGVDLYNFAYWWESHEVFEAFWHAFGCHTQPGKLFRALIQVAAANLKCFLVVHQAADRLNRSALDQFKSLPDWYMGVNVRAFAEDVCAYSAGRRDRPALILLGSS